MKRLLFLIVICLSYQMTLAQNTINGTPEVYQDSTIGFSFEINYWFNLHHFLWLESFMEVNMDSTTIVQQLPESSRESLDRALEYYKENLVDLNLRSSDYMSEFRDWITGEDKELTPVPAKFRDHMEILQGVSDVYKTSFWPYHKKVCLEVLNDNIELIRQTEVKFAERIIKLSRQFWQSEKIKVDITYTGTATSWNPKQRPYTSIFPTHVVMNALDENDIRGNWLELLYHESTHHLILGSYYFIGGTIQDVSEVMNVNPPRQLDHAYHFYITGELTRQLLEEQGITYDATYMQREGVYSRYYSALEKHLKPYMNREMTLEQATRKIINELN